METELQFHAKKLHRIQNKKRKIAAYLTIADLNETDKKKNIHKSEITSASKKLKLNDKVASEKKPFLAPGPELDELRKRLRETRTLHKNIPHLRLSTVGEASVFKAGQESVPLLLSDVQDLLAFFITANTFYSPRWCKVDKISRLTHMAIVVIDKVTSYKFSNHESELKSLDNFDAKLETLLPMADCGNFVDELAHVAISPAHRRRLLEQHGTVDGVLQNFKHLKYKMLRAMFPIKSSKTENANMAEGDSFPRTHLLLDVPQLLEDNFPLPYAGLTKNYSDFVCTKTEYSEVSDISPLFAIDCEMCTTKNGPELTRVSVVDESLTLVYDSLVKPDLPITDYLTRYSGVNAKMMENVTTKLADVQKALIDLLPSDAILVGQSLNCDLVALKMMHPYIIDTSVIYNLTGERSRKSKLVTLAREFLGERIQCHAGGHCPIEDSTASLKLVKLKLKNSVEFGDAVQVGRNEVNVHIASATAAAAGATSAAIPTCPQLTQGLVHCALEVNRTIAIVGDTDIVDKYVTQEQPSNLVTCSRVKDATEALKAAVKVIPNHEAAIIHLPKPESMADMENWIKSLKTAMPPLGMLVVLLAGRPPNKTGLCCLKINKAIS